MPDYNKESIQIIELGVSDYDEIADRMRQWTLARNNHTQDECWVTEHKPAFTIGQKGINKRLQDNLINNDLHIPVKQSDRGGKTTYHGPGQIIFYLLLDIKRRKMTIKELVYNSEQLVIDFLKGYMPSGTNTSRIKGMPGVYVNHVKIASLGFRVSHGKSYHGISFNHAMDLTPFSYIDVCGYQGLQVTDLSSLGIEITRQEVINGLLKSLEKLF